MIELSIFYGFSSLAIIAALAVVFAKNPVRAVLFLVLTFFAMSGVWMMAEAEFLAVTLILVYVGAVMVLFLFVVMMLDIEMGNFSLSLKKHTPIGLIVLGLVVGILSMMVGSRYFGEEAVKIPQRAPESYNNVQWLGEMIFTRYLVPFEVAGVILLVAMIAAIALAFRGRRSKKQYVSEQTYVTKEDRLTVLKMPSESGAKQ